MKKYVEYMDGRQVSDTLHRRLLSLETPKGRPAAWKKYGAAAAALALVVGVGVYGLSQGGWDALADHYKPDSNPEIADVGEPDIATEEPDGLEGPAMKTDGGYEVTDGEMVSYITLPAIEYGMAEDMAELALDWDLPEGCTRRDLTREDIAALFGKAENLSGHLGWGDYEITGWAAWYEDGSFWGAYLNGHKGPLDHFELAFTAGNTIPPACIAYGDGGVVNELWDVPVTAWGYDGQDGVSRRVEFLHDGYGFRFDLTGSDQTQAASLVSRITRWLIVEGVAAQDVTADGAVLAHPDEAGPDHSVGEPNWADSGDCPYCADGTVHTHPYNPGKPAEAISPAPPMGPDDPGAGNLPDGDPAAYEPQA